MDAMEKILLNLMGVIDRAMIPASAIIGALGIFYAIILGSKYATAPSAEELEKVKTMIKNALLGIVLLYLLYLLMYPFIIQVMLPWVRANANNMKVTSF